MLPDVFQLYVCMSVYVYVCVYLYEMRTYNVLVFKPNYFIFFKSRKYVQSCFY